MKRFAVTAFTALLWGSAASAQSIDSVEEAWAIAGRNNIAPSDWKITSYDAESAAFISLSGTAESGRWVALFDAELLRVDLTLAIADCRTGRWRSSQTSARDWSGRHLSDGSGEDWSAPVPGSIGELLFKEMCPNYGRIVSTIPRGRIEGPLIPVPPLPRN